MLKQAIAKEGLESDPKLHVRIEVESFEMAFAATQRLLKIASPPTVIMAENDIVAVAALHGAQRAGLIVPDDLSVTGFDDIPMAAFTFPELTTVAQPFDKIAERAAQRLLARIKNRQKESATEILRTQLIVRQSTGGAPKS